MARPRKDPVYVPDGGHSRVYVQVREADRALHGANLAAARVGRPLPHRVTYRTLVTLNGRQREHYKGQDFTRACAVADRWHRELGTPNPGPLDANVRFAQAMAACLTQVANPNWGRKQMDRARGFARNHLVALGGRRCSTITAADVNKLLITMAEEGYAPDTVQGVHDLAKRVIHWSARNGATFGGRDIAADIKMPRKVLTMRDGAVPAKPGEVRPLDHAKLPTAIQVRTLIDAAETLFGDLPRDLFELIDDTGLRFGEAVGLRPEQWDPKRQGFVVDRQLNEYDSGWEFTLPKYDKVRFVVVSPHLVPRIEARIRHALDMHAATFPSGKSRNRHRLLLFGPKGGWLSRSNVRQRYLLPAAELSRQWAQEQGRPEIAWPEDRKLHSLRHRWVMECYRDLTDAYGDAAEALLDTSRMAGHHNPGYTAKKYLSADDDYADRIRTARNRHLE